MNPALYPLLLIASVWPYPAHASTLDLPQRAGSFWLQPDGLPLAAASAAQTDAVRFASLAALTEHALRTRPDSRAAWLDIQAEAARLDAASAANWPTLTGQFNFIQSRALSSSGTSAPTLNRYGLFYSNSTLIANEAWMITRQLGFENNYVLDGGLNYWFEVIINPEKPASTSPDEEQARYNFRMAASKAMGGGDTTLQPAEKTALPQKPAIKPAAKKKKAAGGC